MNQLAFKFAKSFTIILLIVASLATPFVASASNARVVKHILILYSQDKWHPAHELTEKGIRTIFASNPTYDLQVSAEYLEVDYHAGHDQMMAMADFLRRKYVNTKFDAIITVYPTALDFLKTNRQLFAGVPIIAGEITPDYADKIDRTPLRTFVTGTIADMNVTAVLEDIFRLKPQTKRIALVSGVAPNDVYSEQMIRRGLEALKDLIEVIDITKASMDETLAKVGSLPPDTVIFYSSIFKDGSGKSYVPRDALYRIARTASVPVFGLYDSYLGYGIVGGRLLSFEQQGKAVARLALRVMAGEAPAGIPWGGQDTYINAFDSIELSRWGIPRSALPAGSELRFHIPSFWEEHHRAVIGTLCLLVIETALLIGLFVNIRRRRHAEVSLQDSEDRVKMAIDAASAGLWCLDRDGRLVWATDRTFEIYGLHGNENVTLERLLYGVHPDDRDVVRHAAQRVWETGEDTAIEYRLVKTDGCIRWVAVRCGIRKVASDSEPVLIGVSIDSTRSKRAEDELVNLAGRLINNQEEELRRLSRELHDDLTQRLAVLSIDAGMLEKEVSQLYPGGASSIGELKSRLIDVSNDVHHLSRSLHPAVLEDLGLVQAARAECDTFQKRTGIDLTFAADEIMSPAPKDVALCLYRVLQEALQNIAKHSQSKKGHVAIHYNQDGIRLLIQDFGIGFDKQQVSIGGIGLSSMRERVRLVNGMLTINSAPGEGTKIKVFIPQGASLHEQTAYSVS
jgi:PAS domain S-box-containing protein